MSIGCSLAPLWPLCSSPCCPLTGVARVLEALTSGCRDPVLAVAAPATASLAAFCGMLGTAAAAAGPATAAAKEALPACLQLAVAAAEGSDKVRPSGLQALGGLFELASRLADQVGRQTAEELAAAASTEQQQLTAAVAAIQSCLASSNARVQWAACEAAGALLASHAPAVQQRAPAVLHDLLRLLQRCPNFRSRALAAAALRRLVALPAVASGGGAEPLGAVRLLDAVAGVLFEGKGGREEQGLLAGGMPAAALARSPPHC